MYSSMTKGNKRHTGSYKTETETSLTWQTPLISESLTVLPVYHGMKEELPGIYATLLRPAETKRKTGKVMWLNYFYL